MPVVRLLGSPGLGAIAVVLVLAGCSSQTPDTGTSFAAPREPQGESVDGPEVIASMIDDYAGHPDDPQLPSGTVGASDEALAATNSREIADLLNVGVAFARKNKNTPRYLFALGRAALFHGYARLADELLNEAASQGSGAASAYLGFQAHAEGSLEAAREHLRTAIERRFDTPAVRQTLAAVSDSAFNPARFNRPDLIQALHQGDFTVLRRNTQVSWLYVGTLHNTLWNDSVLFIVDDPNIFLELDPSVAAKAGFASKVVEDSVVGKIIKAIEVVGSGDEGNEAETTAELAVLQDQATQDGRRLAMLYETAPDDFRKIYQGIRSFLGVG